MSDLVPHAHCFKFDTDHPSNEVIPEPLGRLVLGKDHTARMMLLPDGMHLLVPDNASQFVHVIKVPVKSSLVTPGGY